MLAEPKTAYKVKKVDGYYRYTDIWFKWAEAMPDEHDWQPIKCFFAHDSLAHIDHPFHPGREGIEMFVGILKNGESRLLFSSKQVEYARYWIYAMGLTREPLPLPCSDVLLLDSELQKVGPVTYKTGGELKMAHKNLDKFNKRIAKGGIDSRLGNRRVIFESVRSLWAEKEGVWCAIDIESYEYEHSTLTEFGWSLQRWEAGEPVSETRHLCTKEDWNLRNGKFVDDARERFDFGKTEIVPRVDFRKRIKDLLESLQTQYGAVFLVFHDASGDIKYLREPNFKINASLPNLMYVLPDKCTNGLYCVDTNDLWGALEGKSSDTRKLERVARELGFSPKNMHNAGNDAYYTLAALRAMAEGGTLDLQRKERFPDKTDGIKIIAPEEDEDEEDELDDDLPNMKSVLPGAVPAAA